MKNGLQSYTGLFKTISSLISIHASTTQAMILFDLLIRDVTDTFSADYAFIQLKFQPELGNENNFSKAYGLPEEQCLFINNFAKSNVIPSNLNYQHDNLYVFHFNKLLLSDLHLNESIRSSKVKTILIVPIISTEIEFGSFSLYFTTNEEITADQIALFSSIGELLANAYINRITHQNLLDQESMRYDFFWESYDAQFIIDENFNIINLNKAGKNLLGINQNRVDYKFTDFIDQSDFALILINVQNLQLNESSKPLSINWKYQINPEGSPDIIKISFGFKKIKDQTGKILTIASGRTHHIKEPASMQSQLSNEDDIIAKLSEFRELFNRSVDLNNTALLAKDIFFPASFVFIVNEETGPLPLVSTPPMDHNDIMEDTVRLLAGLNTNQIESQYYITGSTPWSNPLGELRWIAFSKPNPKARGNVEFHLIGLVITQNLLTVLPQMVQILLGILLGAMNTYLGILQDDNADFSTERYDGDRNFSTLTLIRETLDELRIISSEILGATLTGEDNLF